MTGFGASGGMLVLDGHLISRLRATASRSAPKQPFRLFRCSGRLIRNKQSPGLFIPKRSTSRALPLRVNPQGEAKGCYRFCLHEFFYRIHGF